MRISDLKLHTFKAALFDLDGVIIDTEPQYTVFWGGMGREYRPDIPDFAYIVKGHTLTEISTYFKPKDMPVIKAKLDAFEAAMVYNYIPGAREYLESLHFAGIPTIMVTSSNQEKMASLRKQHPEIEGLFDKVLTSENFKASKPDPFCYQLGAREAGFQPGECVVFEDSIAGLTAGRRAGCLVVGLTTTNAPDAVGPLSDLVIPDFRF